MANSEPRPELKSSIARKVEEAVADIQDYPINGSLGDMAKNVRATVYLARHQKEAYTFLAEKKEEFLSRVNYKRLIQEADQGDMGAAYLLTQLISERALPQRKFADEDWGFDPFSVHSIVNLYDILQDYYALAKKQDVLFDVRQSLPTTDKLDTESELLHVRLKARNLIQNHLYDPFVTPVAGILMMNPGGAEDLALADNHPLNPWLIHALSDYVALLPYNDGSNPELVQYAGLPFSLIIRPNGKPRWLVRGMAI